MKEEASNRSYPRSVNVVKLVQNQKFLHTLGHPAIRYIKVPYRFDIESGPKCLCRHSKPPNRSVFSFNCGAQCIENPTQRRTLRLYKVKSSVVGIGNKRLK